MKPQVVLGDLLDDSNIWDSLGVTTVATTGYINQIEG